MPDAVIFGNGTAPPRDTADWLAVATRRVAYVVVGICYAAAALTVASTKHLRMDEVLAVWAARLPTSTDVIAGIWHGAEFSPPTYDLVLHALIGVFGDSLLLVRLPSVLAIFAIAIIVARIVAQRLDPVLGLLVFGLILGSRLFDFAIQARPYAIMLMLQVIAVRIWIDIPARKADPRRATAVAALLAAGLSLHVYGVVGIAMVGVLEALRTWDQRHVRPLVWLGLAAAALSCVAWLPLFRHLAVFNQGDTSAPAFYAKPTLEAFIASLGWLSVTKTTAITLALLVVGAAVWARGRPAPPPTARDPTLVQIAVALITACPLAFLMSVLVTHAYSLRYALPASLGFVLLLVVAIQRLPAYRVIAWFMVPILCLGFVRRAQFIDSTAQAADLLASMPGHQPIVVGEGQMFLQLMEAAPADVRSRLVFLTTPPGFVALDPTNEHQILRLLAVRPDLPVKDSLAFFANHRQFLEFFRVATTPDTIRQWIEAKHWPTQVEVRDPTEVVDKVKVPRSDADPS